MLKMYMLVGCGYALQNLLFMFLLADKDARIPSINIFEVFGETDLSGKKLLIILEWFY